jgi:hypothetical protein
MEWKEFVTDVQRFLGTACLNLIYSRCQSVKIALRRAGFGRDEDSFLLESAFRHQYEDYN